MTTASAQIDSAFTACVPAGISLKEKKELLCVLLQKYNSMRAGDFLRTLRKQANSNHSIRDNFSIRSAIVATQLMAAGKAPQAVSGK